MDRPNIALIMLDSFRYDHLWRTVHGEALCPHLAAFARQAVSFETAISPAPFTGAAHASLWTGRLPVEHGAFTLDQLAGQPFAEPDLVELLRRAGYVCVAVSANPWISRDTALGCGFDIVLNGPALDTGPPSGVEEGFLAKAARKAGVLARSLRPESARERAAPDCRALLRQSEKLVDAVPIVLRALRQKWPEKPVFLFVNLMATHDPYLFRPADAESTRPEGAAEAQIVPRRFQTDFWLDLLGVEPVSDQERVRLRWSYTASARYADLLAGRVLASVDECLGREGTDIVVMADHGELLGEHGFFEHGVFLYEPLVHVPLLVRAADLAAGKRAVAPVQTHWAWRLMIDWAGLSEDLEPRRREGDLRAAAAEGFEGGPVYSFADPDWEMRRMRVALLAAARDGVDAARVAPRPMDSHVQAVRADDRVLIRTRSGADLAFRIEDGTRERELAAEELASARQALAPHLLDFAPGPANARPGPGPLLERLRNLGYTD